MKIQKKNVLVSQVKWLGCVLLLALPMVLATSCSKDEDAKNEVYISGLYVGALTTEDNVPVDPMLSLTIESNGKDKVTIKTEIDLSLFIGSEGFSLDVVCPADVTSENGKYVVRGSTEVTVPIGGISLSLTVSVDGTITPGVIKTASINIIPDRTLVPAQFKFVGGTL